METHSNWRPPESEILRAVKEHSSDEAYWVKARLRILKVLKEHPDATNIEIAPLAQTKLRTVDGLFGAWALHGIAVVAKFGRPSEISDEELQKVKMKITSGALTTPEAIQKHISMDVLKLPEKRSIPIARARALYREVRGPKRKSRKYSVPRAYLDKLKLSKPTVARALEEVIKGVSLRKAAFPGSESLLRYYLKQAANPETKSLPRGFREAFFKWCDKESEVTFEGVRGYLLSQGVKCSSERTVYRYIERWKRHKGLQTGRRPSKYKNYG